MGELCLLGYPIMTIPVWDKFPVVIIIANEQPRKDARLRGEKLIEPCAIVPEA